jgi:ubiquinone/menaquinone biosynthesis C-methylase UbiE
VIGCDLAEPALNRARSKARAQQLGNVEFRASDVEHTGLPPGSFDAVVCVFGIFFLPDVQAGLAELWRLVRPGGTLAVTASVEWLRRHEVRELTAGVVYARAGKPR